MKKHALIHLAGAVLLYCAMNTESLGPVMHGVGVVGNIAVMLALIVVMIPLPRRQRGGRYRAAVTVQEWDVTREIWSGQFKSRLVASLMARRAALRHEYLGDVYSQFPLRWDVEECFLPLSTRTAPMKRSCFLNAVPLFRKS